MAWPAAPPTTPLLHLPPPTPAGKGGSEWYYSWVPLLAPLAGGAAAGGLYLAVQEMNQSRV